MFSFAEYIDLPLIWSGLIALAILIYMLLDGFDLGIGILLPFIEDKKQQNIAVNSIAPFWDGNETWIVLGGGGLLAAFPLAYAIVMPALYLPIFAMLFALVFRGVAIEFRLKSPDNHKQIWNRAFHVGSLMAAFFQGTVLGACIEGITVTGRAFSGGTFDWISPFTFAVGIAVVFIYMLTGSSWLIMKTTGELQDRAYSFAKFSVFASVIGMAVAAFFAIMLQNPPPADRLGVANIYYWSVIPLLIIGTATFYLKSVMNRREYSPILYSFVLLFLGYIGILIAIYPNIIDGNTTLWTAAAADESLSLMLVGALIMLPAILGYVGFCYWAFRGKITEDFGYGH